MRLLLPLPQQLSLLLLLPLMAPLTATAVAMVAGTPGLLLTRTRAPTHVAQALEFGLALPVVTASGAVLVSQARHVRPPATRGTAAAAAKDTAPPTATAAATMAVGTQVPRSSGQSGTPLWTTSRRGRF